MMGRRTLRPPSKAGWDTGWPGPVGRVSWPQQPSPLPPRAELPGAWARAGVAEDAGLLVALRQVTAVPTVRVRLVLLTAGCAPITALALALAEVAPLGWLAVGLVAPTAALAVGVGVRQPVWGRRALVGLAAGLVATGAYDLLRLGGVAMGVWADPIPGIGGMLMGGAQPTPGWWVVGYFWRYLGDGGALGAAYAALPSVGPRSGAGFGAAVCAGLLGLLALAPQTQAHFLPLSWVTAAGALAGHLTYGGVLGWLARRWLRPRPAARKIPPAAAPPAIDARASTGPMAAAAPAGPRRANGPVLAVVVAAGVGWATLGLLAAAGGTNQLVGVMLSYLPAGGPLTGSATLAVLTGALTWANLHLRWSGRWLDPGQALWVVLLLIGVGLAGTIGCALEGCLAPLEAG